MLAEQNHTTTITIQSIENGTSVPVESPIKKSERRYPNRASYTTNSTNSSGGSNHNSSGSDTSYTTSTPTTTVASSGDTDSTSKSRRKLAQTSWVSFQDNLNDNYLERGRRINGLQLPLHPLQISGWVALFGFGVSTFCVLIPALHPDLQAPLFLIVSSLYVIHGCSHVAALLIDPSDSELRKHSSKRIVPEFDRTKHAHVIENGRCHLCNIKTTNSRTKHCSVCNKCVAQFDHHCKWLNHCVGGRNYVAFLMCVVSAVIAAMVILAAVVAELVLYYMKSEWLTIWSAAAVSTSNLTIGPTDNDTFVNGIGGSIPSAIFNETFIAAINDTTIPPDTVFNVTETIFDGAQDRTTNVTAGISLHDTIFLTFISIIGILAAITVGLLLHLCFFHVYISFLGLTTYEYIRNQRHIESQNQSKKSLATANATTTTTNTITSNNKTTLNALKKSSTANQIYFCSHIDPKNLVENHSAKAKHRPKSIYCCDTSMQYDSSTHTAFYFCSVLHDRPSPILVPSSMAHELTLNSSRSSRSKTFHCCSEYKQIVKVSTTSSQTGYGSNGEEAVAHNDETMTETSLASSATDEYVKFMEQCTFCSFKLKTKMKKSKVAAIEPQLNNHRHNHRSEVELKSMRKPKWNCCSNVPESPDSEISVTPQIDTISASIDPKANRNHIHHRLRGGAYDEHKLHAKNGAKSMNSIAKQTTNGSIVKPIKEPINRKNRSSSSSSSLSTSLKSGNRSRSTAAAMQRTWPIRIRHMLRMFGRCQQPHYPNNNSHVNSGNNSGHHHRTPSPRRNIKQNQVRPMDVLEQQCEELQQQRRQQSSSSSSAAASSSSLHDTTRNQPNHLHKAALTDRDDLLENNNSPNDLAAMKSIATPAPPPPQRRKISSAAADMQELAESLSFVQNPSHHHHHYPSRGNKLKEPFQQQKAPSQQRPLLAISRKRRRNIFRSPNLSPIHESGYSNPTSPKPCRHGGTQQDSESSASTPKITHQYH